METCQIGLIFVNVTSDFDYTVSNETCQNSSKLVKICQNLSNQGKGTFSQSKSGFQTAFFQCFPKICRLQKVYQGDLCIKMMKILSNWLKPLIHPPFQHCQIIQIFQMETCQIGILLDKLSK